MKVKANSVKQEYEKQDELKRSALRAVSALLTIPDAGNFFLLDYTVKNYVLCLFYILRFCIFPQTKTLISTSL